MRQNRGILRIYADKASGKILGGSLIGPRCEHLAHLVAWAVEHGMTVADALQKPYYHPVVEEALQNAMHDLAMKIPGCGMPMRQFKRLSPDYPRQVQLP
jgi:dihydrolipoamide dehydrogenase